MLPPDGWTIRKNYKYFAIMKIAKMDEDERDKVAYKASLLRAIGQADLPEISFKVTDRHIDF